MDVLAYLNRIGVSYDEAKSPDLALLTRLMTAHICTVPYENVDILDGVPISLKLEDIYDKIVTRSRGGYCFELNALFSWLLTELGFHVESCFARFWRGESGVPLRRHRVLLVTVGEKCYVADVGIGSVAPRIPLLLKEGLVQENFGECYRFVREDPYGFMLYELRLGKWEKYFSFTEERQMDADFIQASFYCEKHPDSPFNKSLMVALKTPTGRRTLDGNVYKEFEGTTLTLIKEGLSNEELNAYLMNKFHISR